MGKAMLDTVIGAGFPVVIYDVSAEALEPYRHSEQAVIASTPAEVARQSAVVDVVVNTDQQVLDVCLGDDGLLAGSRAGTVLLLHSTIGLPTLRKVASAGEERGVYVLDAPVSGRLGHMSVGDLTVMVGGDAAAFAAAKPVLETYGGLVLHLGALGAGLDTKLALNVVRYQMLLAATEANGLLRAAGVEAAFPQIVEHSGANQLMYTSPETRAAYGGAPQFAPERLLNNAATARKDLRAAVARGAELGVAMPAAAKAIETVHGIWNVDPPADFTSA